MATGLGVPHVVTAEGAQGTTPEDMQRIIAASYASDGIIDGCKVTGTATLSYEVSAGAVVMNTGTDMAIIVPVPATTVTTTAAPATGTRTDTIYVQQRLPSPGSPDNSSFVGVTSGALPANSIVLDKRTVAAGSTATSAAPSVHNRKFALTIGGSLGTRYHQTITEATVRQSGTFRRGSGVVVCPTDRDVDFRFISTVSAVTAAGAIANATGSLYYRLYIDGNLVRTFERAYNGFFESKQFSYLARLSEGEHPFYYEVERSAGGDVSPWRVRHGSTEKWPGDILHVIDVGVSNA